MPTDEATQQDSGHELPDWVRDPARAYAEIRRTRDEARRLREERATADANMRLKQQEDHQLAEQYQAELETLRTKAAEAELTALRVKVAAEAGIPAQMAARLVGLTEDELKADAEGLRALLIPASAPTPRGVTHGTTPAPRGAPQGETDEQRRTRLFGRGGYNPIFERKRSGG